MYDIEQLVMAYGIEQDRIRALLDGFTSPTPARQFSVQSPLSRCIIRSKLTQILYSFYDYFSSAT